MRQSERTGKIGSGYRKLALLSFTAASCNSGLAIAAAIAVPVTARVCNGHRPPPRVPAPIGPVYVSGNTGMAGKATGVHRGAARRNREWISRG